MEIGAVLALRSEKITKKAAFSVFTEKVADYVISNHKYGSDIEQAIRKLRDPMEGFVDLYKPPPLTVQDPTFDDKLIQQERIKSYISRENALKDNTTKVYGIV